jgi:hypothetical protein
MLVLDEQLLGRDVEERIADWYRGRVVYITDLRPNTVIKDEAIPLLLRQQKQPTFVTINESDFWSRTAGDQRFCIICFALPDSRVHELPSSLRRILHQAPFRTKSQRMGSVLRVTNTHIHYYTASSTTIQSLALW